MLIERGEQILLQLELTINRILFKFFISKLLLIVHNYFLFACTWETQQIGKTLLPSPANGKALPASTDSEVQKADDASESVPQPKVEAAADPPPQVNSVPKTEVKADSLPGFQRPLSPYPAVMLTSSAHEILAISQFVLSLLSFEFST